MRSRKAGFSLLEAMAVVAIVGIASAVALVQMKTTMQVFDADKAANLVVSQMNYARQLAVDERRNVLVEFLNTNEIKITRNESGGGTTVVSDVTLPSGYTYGLPGGGVGDTPDAFGATVAVFFNSGNTGTFLGDGTFVDNSNVLLSGTVFTIGGGNGTARAVTLAGATGRIKQYWLQGTSWIVR